MFFQTQSFFDFLAGQSHVLQNKAVVEVTSRLESWKDNLLERHRLMYPDDANNAFQDTIDMPESMESVNTERVVVIEPICKKGGVYTLYFCQLNSIIRGS